MNKQGIINNFERGMYMKKCPKHNTTLSIIRTCAICWGVQEGSEV